MNNGTPCNAVEPELDVSFTSSRRPLELLIKDWLSDNPNYQELFRDGTARVVRFRTLLAGCTSSGPLSEFQSAMANKLLNCPKCKSRILASENFKVNYSYKTAVPGGLEVRQYAGDEVTLVCYKCGAETRVNNWRNYLTQQAVVADASNGCNAPSPMGPVGMAS
jgi:DNA-directed RNA polymerase subunit RPC12/RpoP